MTDEQRAKKREQARARYAANPEKYRKYQRERQLDLYRNDPAYKEKVSAQRLAWQKDNRLKLAAYRIKHKYKMSTEQWDLMFAQQGKRCAACGSDASNWKTRDGRSAWHTDHCHSSGKVRGILCHHCNTALGALREDTTKIRRLAAYLEGNQ